MGKPRAHNDVFLMNCNNNNKKFRGLTITESQRFLTLYVLHLDLIA